MTVPAADKKWHPVAARWYRSLKTSGQAVFYEPSDWAVAFLIAEAMSRELKPQPVVSVIDGEQHVEMCTLPPKGASLAAWLKAMTSLMVTEGDRRRLHLELERGAPAVEGEDASVAYLDEFRGRAQSS